MQQQIPPPNPTEPIQPLLVRMAAEVQTLNDTVSRQAAEIDSLRQQLAESQGRAAARIALWRRIARAVIAHTAKCGRQTMTLHEAFCWIVGEALELVRDNAAYRKLNELSRRTRAECEAAAEQREQSRTEAAAPRMGLSIGTCHGDIVEQGAVSLRTYQQQPSTSSTL